MVLGIVVFLFPKLLRRVVGIWLIVSGILLCGNLFWILIKVKAQTFKHL
ncbi:DUF3096 domain-containing protein [Candidatus Pacearchaeota archaeon]|nr:DUF3096 domain-containing protein [Candidatus Pacearchaeota archaeon]